MKTFSKAAKADMELIITRIESAMALTTDPETYVLLGDALAAARRVNSTEGARLFRMVTIKRFKK